MLRAILISAAVVCGLPQAYGQIEFSGDYTEDFDSMGSAGTEYPAGWSGARAEGSGEVGAALDVRVSTGTSTGGGLYNVGLSGDSDRALGSLASSSTMPTFGVQFINQSDNLFTQLSLEGIVEQWRQGSSMAIDEFLTCEYSLDALGLVDTSATWFVLSDLNLTEQRVESTSSGAVDGNQAVNRLEVSGLVDGIEWNQGEVFTLRWTDSNDTGSDSMLALDDFHMFAATQPVPEPSSVGMGALGISLLIAWRRKQRRSP